MNEERKADSIWKGAALFLAGIVLSSAIAWSTYVRTAVTREDVQKMIEENNKNYQTQIDYLNKSLDGINGKLDAMARMK